MLQIFYPKLDMSNIVDLCHAKLRKRRRNIDRINDAITPVAEKMIEDLLRMILLSSRKTIMLIPWVHLRKVKG
jgi:hypothetical protein